MTERAVDSLINSSFLSSGDEAALSHLFKDIGTRRKIDSATALLEILDESGIGACVISIMEPDHAQWVMEAHLQYPR